MAQIKLLILDVDGVLTDGRIVYGPEGEVCKAFHAHDGCTLKLWRRLGGRVALITGRSSAIVAKRAADLEIDRVEMGVADKLPVYEALLAEMGVSDDEVAYVGDDVPDLGPMGRCGWPVAVANAVRAVKQRSAYVTALPGGGGAVAEVIERLLRCEGRWAEAVALGAQHGGVTG